MNKNNSTSCFELERNAIDFCGVTVLVISKIWELIKKHCNVPVDKLKQKHLLWTLHHMKQYTMTNTMAATVKLESKTTRPAQKTLIKWIPIVLDAIYELVPHVIKWENRKKGDQGQDCLVSVDGTDCKFQQILIENSNGIKKNK